MADRLTKTNKQATKQPSNEATNQTANPLHAAQ
jgi:hypothetical protein